MNGRRIVVAACASALGFAAVVVLAPDLVPVPRTQLTAAMRDLSGIAGLGGLAVLGGVIALVQRLWSSETPAVAPPLSTDADDRPGPTAGEAFDAQLAAAGRVGEWTAASEASVREDLRELAVDVYRVANDCEWETAARAVEEGRWTDDPAAAAFVGGPDAPSMPLRDWFAALVSDEGAFASQTARTIRAVARLQAEAGPGGRETDEREAVTVAVDATVPGDTTPGEEVSGR